jgi:CubicO group peptidase (beta-lactamase class C family)
MDSVQGLMQRAAVEGVFPGGALSVTRDGREVLTCICGVADIFSGRALKPDTLFDLASLTKPLATTLAVLLLVQDEQLGLDQPLAELLPDFGRRQKGRLTVRQLLAHKGGLPAYRTYFRDLMQFPPERRRDALNRLVAAEPLVDTPGHATVYSDIGFMLLRWIVERVSGMRLDRFVTQRVYRPLGLSDLSYIDLNKPFPDREFAATELCPWRGVLVNGRVHDENAYAVGGVDGQAGLFGTVGAVACLLTELLAAYRGDQGAGLFDTGLLQAFLRPDGPGDRALGFDTPSPDGASSGRWFSKSTVGHLGFTGTSFWMDLARGTSVVLLTNRVHPTRTNRRIQAFRPRLHDAVMDTLRCLERDTGGQGW